MTLHPAIERLLSRTGRAARVDPHPLALPPPDLIQLAYGFPDPGGFPTDALLDATRAVLAEQAATALQYGTVKGHRPLIDWVVRHLSEQDGVPIAPEQVLITSGSGQGIVLVTQLLVDPGDTILVEAPTFLGAVRTFDLLGARCEELPMDEDGLLLDALEARLAELRARGVRPKLLYTHPNFQNPSGATLPLERRRHLVDLAQRYELPVLEDDAYRDLRYDGEDLPSLQALDQSGLVIRLGTFSKILAPGMRLAWIVAQPEVTQRLAAAKAEGGTSPYGSHLAAAMAQSGALDRHIAFLKPFYRARRDAMLAALERYCADYGTWSRPAGGFFVWLRLADRVDPERLAAAAAAERVGYLSGRACFPSGRGERHVRLAFSYLPPERISEGVRRFGRALARAATPTAATV